MSTAEAVLACPMDREKNDAKAGTVKEYLLTLLLTVWNEGEGFSGKRPFGNAGWEYEIHAELIRAGLVDGELDADGYIDRLDDQDAYTMVADAIKSLGANA